MQTGLQVQSGHSLLTGPLQTYPLNCVYLLCDPGEVPSSLLVSPFPLIIALSGLSPIPIYESPHPICFRKNSYLNIYLSKSELALFPFQRPSDCNLSPHWTWFQVRLTLLWPWFDFLLVGEGWCNAVICDAGLKWQPEKILGTSISR